MKTGLTSITFRQKSISEIIQITKNANLKTIEWGSDIHCPYDDTSSLKKAYEETQSAGLEVSSYGTYFRLGITDIAQFTRYCDAATILHTDIIRIWAYNKNPNEVTQEEYTACIDQAKAISDMAKEHNITVCFEYHRGTLTQNSDSAVKLINDIGRENIRLYWQPNPEISAAENKTALGTVLPYAVNIHCFKWQENNQRLPLSEGFREWREYVRIANSGNVRNILIEFVKDDSAEQLVNDANTLTKIVNS